MSKIVPLILEGAFAEAEAMIQDMEYMDVYNLLIEDIYAQKDLTFYGFFLHLLLNAPQSDALHSIISILLSNPLCTIAGAYPLAVYHIQQAIQLNPSNKEYATYLEHLNSIPW